MRSAWIGHQQPVPTAAGRGAPQWGNKDPDGALTGPAPLLYMVSWYLDREYPTWKWSQSGGPTPEVYVLHKTHAWPWGLCDPTENCLQNVHVWNWQGTKTIGLIWISVAGIPSPQAARGYQSLAWWEQEHSAGGEQWAGKQSFICIYSRSPSLHYCLSSTSCERRRNKYNTFESSHNHPCPLVYGKTVSHETSPWCRKSWRLLL